MKRGKRAVLGALFLGVIIISLSFVSASWLKDLFTFGDNKNLEGEVPVSKPVSVNVQVSGAYPAPDVISISSLNSKMTEASVLAADRTLATGGNSQPVTFKFYVYSSAGSAALPANPTAAQAYVTIVYTGAVSQPGGKQIKSGICTSSVVGSFNTVTGDDISGNDAFGTKNDVREYSCTVNVPYYANYGNYWDIRAYIEDLSSPTPNKEGYEYLTADTGNWLNNGVGHEFPLRQTYFNRLEEWKVDPNAVDFGSVGFGDAIDKQPTALTQPKIIDLGNIDVDMTKLQGSDLQDVDNNDATSIPASWFYSHPTTPCDTASAVNLDATLKNVMGDNIAYGPTSNSKDLKICLKKVLAGTATAQSYSTTAVGGSPWNVDVTTCLNPGCI